MFICQICVICVHAKMKKTFILLIAITNLFTLSKGQQSGRDIFLYISEKDSLQKPIGGCVAYCGNSMFVSADDGIMKIRVSQKDSICELRHLGFEPLKIDVRELNSVVNRVELNRGAIELPEVEVNAKKIKYKRRKVGITSKDISHVSHIGRRALYIPNYKKVEGYTIETIHVYVHEYGNPYTPFYITVYEAEADSIAPKNELKKIGPIRTVAKSAGAYHVVDISRHKIDFGKNGIFVEVEADPEKEPVTEYNKVGKRTFQKINDTLGIGYAWQEVNKFYCWRYVPDKGWQREKLPETKLPKRAVPAAGNLMIYSIIVKRK